MSTTTTGKKRQQDLNVANDVTIGNNITVTGDLYVNGAEIWGDNKSIVQFDDTYLRLNPNNEFTSGVYVGSLLKADSGLQIGSLSTTGLFIPSDESYMNWKGNQVATESWVNAQNFITEAGDNQTLTWSNGGLSISGGNLVTIDGRYGELATANTWSGIQTISSLKTDTITCKNGNYLVVNVGESAGYATAQAGEILYINSESGLQVNSSPDNWATLWAGRNTVTICAPSGNSIFNNIAFNSDSTYDIGASSLRPANIYADNINAGDATIDSYVFSSGVLTQSSYGTWTWGSGYSSLYANASNVLKLGSNNVQGVVTINVDGSTSLTGDLDIADSKYLNIGTSNDLQLYHDGTNSYILNNTGALNIGNISAERILFRTGNLHKWTIETNGNLMPFANATYDIGTLGNSVKTVYSSNIYVDTYLNVNDGFIIETAEHVADRSSRIIFKENSNSYLYGLSIGYSGDTTAKTYESSGATTVGTNALWYFKRHDNNLDGVTFMYGSRADNNIHYSGNAYYGDNNSIYLGNGNDIRMFHDGSNSWIVNSNGIMVIRNNANSSLNLGANSITSWIIEASGDLRPNLGSTYDIGSISYKVKTLYSTYLGSSDYPIAATYSNNYSVTSGDGAGVAFWNNSTYKIYMSTYNNITWGGRLDTTSDYNMYFKMANGTNRGFVFLNNTTPVAQIESDGNVICTSVTITDGAGNSKFKISYNETEDSLDTVKL